MPTSGNLYRSVALPAALDMTLEGCAKIVSTVEGWDAEWPRLSGASRAAIEERAIDEWRRVVEALHAVQGRAEQLVDWLRACQGAEAGHDQLPEPGEPKWAR